MAWTQSQLDALETAIVQGVTSVTYDGERVEYRSIAEMLQLRGVMRSALGLNGSMGARRYAIFDPGT